MLKELHIKNYALFEEVHLELGPHFNVFTGETGAGKSLLVGAIGLLLGNKGESIMVRQGCREAEVTGVLRLAAGSREARSWLESYEIPLEPDESGADHLTVRRILKVSGKSSCYIQHVPISRARLEEFMALLFDLHSQHQNQSLFHNRQQLHLLDHYARLEQCLEEFGKTFQDINQQKKQLAQARSEAERQREQIIYLRSAVEEIEELQPQEDEDVALGEQIELLSNVQNLREDLEQLLREGQGALERLDRSQSYLGTVAAKLGAAAELLPRLQSASIEIEDILDSCKAEKNALQPDPEQLHQLDQRLSQLIALSRKYGNSSLNESIRFGAEAREKLVRLESTEDSLSQREEAIQAAEQKLMQEAQYLSRQRKKYAPLLEQSIEENLHNLGMGQACFQIELAHRSNEEGHVLCHSHGIDTVRFLLSANPGESPREIRQVASGGEISRIMLAIKSQPIAKVGTEACAGGSEAAESRGIETVIFDEIDTGIGGETGIRLAEHIHRLGQHRQVLCVTHLASIAACANHHIKIDKQSDTNSTSIYIYALKQEQRTTELARMLSGDTQNPASLAHAQELLNRY